MLDIWPSSDFFHNTFLPGSSPTDVCCTRLLGNVDQLTSRQPSGCLSPRSQDTAGMHLLDGEMATPNAAGHGAPRGGSSTLACAGFHGRRTLNQSFPCPLMASTVPSWCPKPLRPSWVRLGHLPVWWPTWGATSVKPGPAGHSEWGFPVWARGMMRLGWPSRCAAAWPSGCARQDCARSGRPAGQSASSDLFSSPTRATGAVNCRFAQRLDFSFWSGFHPIEAPPAPRAPLVGFWCSPPSGAGRCCGRRFF